MITMSDPKHVKVDNWGVFFLQRLKHFFNRTDYCDLTLQFQDNAQLKVHRLVLSACTEYFEVLERTCEMYEDCLVMPDDLQSDVVVPIVNFMYTGQLEFKMDALEKLHACSEIMNMPVLTKLLNSHRPKNKITHSYSKRQPKPQIIHAKCAPSVEGVTPAPVQKRSFSKAFEKSNVVFRDKKHHLAVNKATTPMSVTNGVLLYRATSPVPLEVLGKVKIPKIAAGEPRPTRYELPEELDTDNLFENSFCNISYTSQPLMVHPETTKQYAKRPRQDNELASTSKKSRSTLDIVECKKITKEPEENLFEESPSDEAEMFKPAAIKKESAKDPNKLFDQLLDHNEHSAKVTIETTKNNKAGANLDHAKIISEVLKKYPHLVKSNKNIKLKIFNNPTPGKTTKKQKPFPQPVIDKPAKYIKADDISDYTYETDVLDSKQAARLIALGAENIDGPWICLICGTPGKALHFTSYFTFRRHLVEVHNEKPVLNICEYCGQKISKRNHLLHHMYTKHGVEPPASYNFPKCSLCNYIALTEVLLVKHKLSHTETKTFRCNVCPASFNSSSQLLAHIQNTGHKYIADRKHSHQCIYCLRVFIRENNLYAHLKTHHKIDAVRDGIIDESDDESKEDVLKEVKDEPVQNDYEENNLEYHIQQKPDGNIQLIQKKPTEANKPSKQKILNSGLTSEAPKTPPPKSKVSRNVHNIEIENASSSDNNSEEIVVIDNNEYIMSGNKLILRKPTNTTSEEYILSDIINEKSETSSQQSMSPSTSVDYATILNSNENIQQTSIILKGTDTENLSEPIPIYVSNEEEYKALMTSNHNIIFDSSDANKTLTVLTTPDAGSLGNTSIDLDNAQNNDDVMIIQDDYPLNVSEAVTTDNSNIVVVYSQQLGDPNKGYQILTTQALGPQYGHSSAIVTHNYETVSTSSPVMSAHILDAEVTTWQGDIDQNINNQHANTSAVLQSVVQVEEVQATIETESVDDMDDLPQAQLIPDTHEPAINDESEDIINESSSEILQLTEPELIQETQKISREARKPQAATKDEKIENCTAVESNPKDVDESQKGLNVTGILKQIVKVPDSDNFLDVEQQPEIISMDVHSSDTNENIVSMDGQSSVTNENIVTMEVQTFENESIESVDVENTVSNENFETMEVQTTDANEDIECVNIQNPATNENIETMEVQTSDTNENIESEDVQNPVTNENIVDMEIQISDTNENTLEPIIETANGEPDCNENELSAAESVEQIQTLTSEWSENVETPTHDINEDTNNQEQEDCETNSGEVEESIENIQQELEKQMIESKSKMVETISTVDEETVDDADASPNHDFLVQDDKSENINAIDTKVKISSLLNDWDDNDSQGDNEMDENVTNPIIENVTSDISNPDNEQAVVEQVTENVSIESAVSQENLSAVPEADEATEDTATDPETNEQCSVIEIVDKVNIKSLVSDWDEEEEENKE